MAQLDARSSGRMGSRALLYYITTTILAAIVGIFMVLVIHPGDPSIKTHVEGGTTDTKVSTLDAILDIIRCVSFTFLTCITWLERRRQFGRTFRVRGQHPCFVFRKSRLLISDETPTNVTEPSRSIPESWSQTPSSPRQSSH